MGEHLPCKQGVMGSNPIISSPDARTGGHEWREAEWSLEHESGTNERLKKLHIEEATEAAERKKQQEDLIQNQE